MEQDKNFTIRLKAAIDKRLNESGFLNKALNGSDHYDDYKEYEQKFFDSLSDITLEVLNGDATPSPAKAEQEGLRWVDESGLTSSNEREVAIAFAEWINRQPYLFGQNDYGWYYDIPIDGAGVDHKLIGNTGDLYQYYLQSSSNT